MEETRKEERDNEVVYLDSEGYEINDTTRANLVDLADDELGLLKEFLKTAWNAQWDHDETPILIAERLLEQAIGRINDTTEFITENHGEISIIRAEHRQRSRIVDLEYVPRKKKGKSCVHPE